MNNEYKREAKKRMLLVTFNHKANEKQIEEFFNKYKVNATQVGKVIKRYTFDVWDYKINYFMNSFENELVVENVIYNNYQEKDNIRPTQEEYDYKKKMQKIFIKPENKKGKLK